MYVVTLSRYKERFEHPPSYSGSNVFILGMSYNINSFGKLLPYHYRLFQSSYQPKSTFSENFYHIMETFSEFMCTRVTTKFYIFNSIWFYILFRKLLSDYTYFSESSYIPIPIFSKSYYPNIHIFTVHINHYWHIKR